MTEAAPAQLIAEAVRHTPDDDRYWNVVQALQRRATPADFAATVTLCRSDVTAERILGAAIIGQLGYEANYPYQARATPVLLALLTDSSEEVVANAAFGAGHQRIASAIPALVRLAQHAAEDLRYAAVHGLMAHDDPRSVRALIALTTDTDARVRDWATFGLGSILETDTAQVREALCARLTDPDINTRDEAIAGLVARGVPRATPALLAALSAETASNLILRAAAEVNDPQVRAALARFA